MIARKKLLISTVIVSGAVILGSCSKSETDTQLRIVDQCNTANDLCKFELTNAVVSRYTNLLGKTIERVESQTPLQDIQGTITWVPPANATVANNEEVVNQLNSGCENGNCTENSNPTAYNLAAGSNAISVSGTITVNGKTVDLATAVPPVTIETEQVADSHVFQRADTPALPDGQTIQNVVDALNSISGNPAHGQFSVVGNSWKITCNQGYEWRTDQNPAWGADSVSNIARGTALATWNGSSWTTASKVAFTGTRNGSGGGIRFAAGCWPIKS